MGTIQKMAEEIGRRLRQALPNARQTVVRKLALAVGAMIEARTPNTAELANVLPLETERQDMREQWLRRLLKNPLFVRSGDPGTVGVPGAGGGEPERAARRAEPGQTDLGDRFAVLMLGLVLGDRALPLAWRVEAGSANIGFKGQALLLERVREGCPPERR